MGLSPATVNGRILANVIVPTNECLSVKFPGAKMYKLLLTFMCCVLFAIPVFADTVNVPFSTSSAGPFSFQADSFSLSGESGLLALDTASFTVGDIATAALIFGVSGSFSGSGNFLLSYNLTLDGVT